MFANLSKKICLLSLLTSFCLHISVTQAITEQKAPETSRARRSRYRATVRSAGAEPHTSIPWKKLTVSQFEDKLEYAKKIFDTELILKILQQLAKTAHQNSNLNKYLLEIADFYFERNQLEKAIEYYQTYCTLYPGSKESEYAAYKSILASFYTTLAPNRDVTPTEQTIELASKFLKQAVRKDYKEEVEAIVKQCNHKLFQHEVYVFEHYVQQKKYKPAQMRLDYIEKNFLNSIKDAQRLFPHLKDLLEKNKNPETRTFIIRVDWEYGTPAAISKAKAKAKAKPRHVDRIKI